MYEEIQNLLARRRFLDGEKAVFLSELKLLLEKYGYDVVMSRDKKGRVASNNILVGPIHTAKAIVVSYYDTPQRRPSFLKYTPLNMQRKVINNFLLRSLKEFATIVIGILLFILMLELYWSDNRMQIMDVLAIFMVLIGMIFVKTALQFPSNFFAKRNNSSMDVMLQLLANLDVEKRDEVAFAFVDNGTMDMQGDRTFSDTLVQLGITTPVVMLDAIGANEPLLLQYLTETESIARKIQGVHVEPAVLGMQSTIHCYQNALLLTRGTKVKKDFVIAAVNTNKDTIADTTKVQEAYKVLEQILQIIRK